MKAGRLFESDEPKPTASGSPLAERMRPRTFDEFVGQHELIARGQPLREAIEQDALQSIILWGPPGTGKTTVARLIATATRAHFIAFSAVLSGIKDIKRVMAEAEASRRQLGRRTIVFIDEIHRFNKAQQDAFLPRVETGDIVLVGATTENPSFEINAALLSRSKVFVLRPLMPDETATLLRRALDDRKRGLGTQQLKAARILIGDSEHIESRERRRPLPREPRHGARARGESVLELVEAQPALTPDDGLAVDDDAGGHDDGDAAPLVRGPPGRVDDDAVDD
mgnify:CR=1 FL=1